MAKFGSWVLVFLVACVVAVAGMAAESGQEKKEDGQKQKGKRASVEERFKQMDKNSDGKITLDEYVGQREGEAKAKFEKRFRKLDKQFGNKGFLNLDDMRKAEDQPRISIRKTGRRTNRSRSADYPKPNKTPVASPRDAIHPRQGNASGWPGVAILVAVPLAQAAVAKRPDCRHSEGVLGKGRGRSGVDGPPRIIGGGSYPLAFDPSRHPGGSSSD